MPDAAEVEAEEAAVMAADPVWEGEVVIGLRRDQIFSSVTFSLV